MKIYINIIVFVLFVNILCNAGNTKKDTGKKDTIAQVKTHSFGLQVDANGGLLLNEKPYQGMGINYFNAFYRTLKDPSKSDTSYIEGFRNLKRYHIPFVRFMACGFWPNDWKLYFTNKDEYFVRFDLLVRSAEHIGIGLIPSLFWNHSAVPDLLNESVNQWGNSNSKTIDFMRKYTAELVERYKDSPAIWGWEFGNELNLNTDLIGDIFPQIAVNEGTPSIRTSADKISTQDLIVAMGEFAKTVRKYDASRIIFSGNAIPRECAYHLFAYQTWEADSVSQYISMLNMQNPFPMNSITSHMYPMAKSKYFSDTSASLKEIIRLSADKARKEKKVLFLGEFGASKELGAVDEKLKFMEILSGIEEYKVPLAAAWVFDYSPQDADWNITPSNPRNYMLEEIGKYNDRNGQK